MGACDAMRRESARESRGLVAQAGEAADGFGERVLALGEMEADEVADWLAEEAGAGDGGDADFAGEPFAKGGVVLHAEFGNIHQDVVGALGFGEGQPGVAQATEEEVAFPRVECGEGTVVGIRQFEPGDRRLLQGAAAPTVRKSWTLRAPSMKAGGAMT